MGPLLLHPVPLLHLQPLGHPLLAGVRQPCQRRLRRPQSQPGNGHPFSLTINDIVSRDLLLSGPFEMEAKLIMKKAY